MIITGIERALRDRLIRYVVAGAMKFTDREEVKDAIAYLQLCVNPHDYIAFERIAGKPARGVGPKAIAAIRGIMMQERLTLLQAIGRAKDAAKPRSAALKRLAEFELEVSKMTEAVAASHDAGEALAEILEISGYLPWRKSLENDPQLEQRLDNLDFIVDEASEHARPIDFLEAMALQAGGDAKWGEDCVVVSTIHASKGLEFDVVYTPALEEGVFPNARSEMTSYGADEERRLAHVAWTRARKELHISYAGFRMGRNGASLPSRYLAEVGMPVDGGENAFSFSKSLSSKGPQNKPTGAVRFRRRSF